METTSTITSPRFFYTRAQAEAVSLVSPNQTQLNVASIDYSTIEKILSQEIQKKIFDFLATLQTERELDYSSILIGKLLENSVLEKYRGIQQVSAITSARQEDFSQFTVYTSNPHYDDQLMNQLIDLEIELKHQFPDLLFAIEYLTFIPDRGKDIPLSQKESLIYQA